MAFNLKDDELKKIIHNALGQSQQTQQAAAQQQASQMQAAQQAAARAQAERQAQAAQQAAQQKAAQEAQQKAQQQAQQQAAQAQQAQQSQPSQDQGVKDYVERAKQNPTDYANLISSLANEINNANIVQSGQAQDDATKQTNIANITKQLQDNSDMVQKAASLLAQRNADYTRQSGGQTDYGNAVERTVQQSVNRAQQQIPVLQQSPAAQVQQTAQAQATGSTKSSKAAAKQTKQATKSVKAATQSTKALTAAQNQTASAAKETQSAQANYNNLNRQYQAQQKSQKKNQTQLQKMQSALKAAQKSGDKDAVKAIRNEIRTYQADNANHVTKEQVQAAQKKYQAAKQKEQEKRKAQAAAEKQAKADAAKAQSKVDVVAKPNQNTLEAATGTVTPAKNEQKTKKSSPLGAALFNAGQAITSGVGKVAEVAENVAEKLFPGVLTDPTVGLGRKVFTEANKENAKQAERNTKEHKVAGSVGTAIGKAGKTMLEVGALNSVGEAAQITKGAAQALQKRGVAKDVAQRAADLAWNQTTDNLTDTLPQLVQDVKYGKSAKQAAKDIVKSNVQNLAFNAAGEMLNQGVNALRNRNAAQQAIPSIADNARLRGADLDRADATQAFLNRAQRGQYNIPGFADTAPEGMAVNIARNNIAQQTARQTAGLEGDALERFQTAEQIRNAYKGTEIGSQIDDIVDGYEDLLRTGTEQQIRSYEDAANNILRRNNFVGDNSVDVGRRTIEPGATEYSYETVPEFGRQSILGNNNAAPSTDIPVRSDRYNVRSSLPFDESQTDMEFLQSQEGINANYGLQKLKQNIDTVEQQYGDDEAMQPVITKLKQDYNDLETSVFQSDSQPGSIQYFSKQLDDDFKAVNKAQNGTVNVRSTSSTLRKLRQTTTGTSAYIDTDANDFRARQSSIIPQIEDETDIDTQPIRNIASDMENNSISTSGRVNLGDNSGTIRNTARQAQPTQADIEAANARSNADWDELVNGAAADEAARRSGQAVRNDNVIPDIRQQRTKTRGNIDETVDRILKRADREPEEYTGRAVTNTIYNSGADTEEEYADVLGSAAKHTSVPERRSVQNALDRVNNNFDGEVRKYTADIDKKSLKNMQSEDVDEMMIIRSRLNQQARAATDQATKDQLYAQSRQVAKNIDQTLHKGGQILQSARKWAGTYDGAVTTAEGRLYSMVDDTLSKMPGDAKGDIDDVARRIIRAVGELDNPDNVNETMRNNIRDILKSRRTTREFSDEQINALTDQILKDKSYESIQENLEFLSTGLHPIRSETYDRVNEIFDSIQKYDFGSKKYADGEQEAYKLLANDIFPKSGGTFGEKVDSWRYFSMLANPTTHIKNITGNTLFQRVFSVKNNLAAAIESAADKVGKLAGGKGIDRTKAVLNRVSDSDLLKASRQDAYDYSWKELTQGGKFTDAAQQIDAARKTFGDSKVGKVVQWLSDRNSDLLEAEDNKALISQYETSLASYLKANGKDASVFNDASDEAQELLSNARAYAINQAKESAFHQDNFVASGYSQFVRGLKEKNDPVSKFCGELLDVMIPFKKTPANILNTTFEYSPAQAIRAIYDVHLLKTHQIKAADFIDDVAKGLTGTAGLGVGMMLTKAGVLKLGTGNGDKESAFNTATGIQGSSIKVGDRYVNITELAPAAAPLIFGAALAETEGSKTDRLLQGLGAIGDSVTDMTMLSGISDILTASKYAESGTDVAGAVGQELASNLASQMLPTIGKKVETTIDSTSRSTYSDKTGMARTRESNLKYLGTKIPGSQAIGEAANRSNIPALQKTLGQLEREPSIDVFGNEKQNNDAGIGGTAGRIVSNFVSPVKITKDVSTDTQNGIRDLARKLGDDDVFPSTTSQEAKVNGEKLAPKDWTNYQKDKGKIVSELANEIMGKDFSDLDDDTKGELLKSAWDYAKKSTQQKYGATETKKIQELDSIYEEGGAKALAEKLSENAATSKANDAIKAETGKDSVSNADKLEYLNGLSKSEAQELVDSGAVARSSGQFEYQDGEWVGVDKDGKVKESKATTEAKELKKTIDAATGDDGSVSNDDKIDYLNSLSKEEAQKLVDSGQVARSSGEFKYQDGKWVGIDKKGKVANTGSGTAAKSISNSGSGNSSEKIPTLQKSSSSSSSSSSNNKYAGMNATQRMRAIQADREKEQAASQPQETASGPIPELGFDYVNSQSYARYQSSAIPGLKSPENYARTFGQIDGYGNSNGHISKNELIAFLDASNYSKAQKHAIWDVYASAQSRSRNPY